MPMQCSPETRAVRPAAAAGLVLALVLAVGGAVAEGATPPPDPRPPGLTAAEPAPPPPLPVPRPADLSPPDRPDAAEICAIIARAADFHGLPRSFLARLIWKESRFDHRARSPVGALGIAQFMPATASARGLIDPYDPAQAIPHSAWFLAELRRAFGNLGLAAAAYNGGPGRVERWLARGGSLPWETIDYVHSITARPVEWFRNRGREVESRPLAEGKPFAEGCAALPVMRTRAVPRPPWGVQVASAVSRGAALAAFRRVKARSGGVLDGASPLVLRSGLRTGARWVARVGAPSRASAGRLCARLKGRGTPCVVLRN